LHTVLYGKKRVVLFSNEESKNLYKHPFNTRSYVDVDNPDFSKFPRLKYVTGYQETLCPGETLFMPSGYWHHMVYEEAGYAICTRCSKLPIARKLRGYVNLLVCFPIDKIMNKLSAEPGFRWTEERGGCALPDRLLKDLNGNRVRLGSPRGSECRDGCFRAGRSTPSRKRPR
jgi:hypothetical protein